MCGFWPCGSISRCLVCFPRPGALACNFLSTKCATYYFSNSLSPVRPWILWFVTGCFCIITAVILAEFSCKWLKYSGTLFLHHEINRVDETFESWLFSYARLMQKITECEEEFLLLCFLSPQIQCNGPAQENATTNESHILHLKFWSCTLSYFTTEIPRKWLFPFDCHFLKGKIT